MRYLLLLLLILAGTPAQAQLQFDSSAAAPAQPQATPGIAWLQHTPASLFDLGMMELTGAATKTAGALFDITGAMAEYQAERGLIALSFYARTAYSDENCKFVIEKLRNSMFPKRDNITELASDLGSYFNTYGTSIPGRPTTTGTELVAIMRFAVFMPGGACQLPLYGSDEVSYWKDPNAPPPQETPQALPSTPMPAEPAPATPPAPSRHRR